MFESEFKRERLRGIHNINLYLFNEFQNFSDSGKIDVHTKIYYLNLLTSAMAILSKIEQCLNEKGQ